MTESAQEKEQSNMDNHVDEITQSPNDNLIACNTQDGGITVLWKGHVSFFNSINSEILGFHRIMGIGLVSYQKV
jgi:hypothetical protein